MLNQTNVKPITMYNEYRYPSPEQAAKKQREIKKQYGYKPEVYLIQPNPNSKDVFFSIVTPKGLVPINRKDKIFDF
jgi:hypothetical protein